jgi:hypothetical protein
MTDSLISFASAIFALRAATHPSRSARLEAWKVCLWERTLKEKSTVPSLVISEASDWKEELLAQVVGKGKTSKAEETFNKASIVAIQATSRFPIAALNLIQRDAGSLDTHAVICK